MKFIHVSSELPSGAWADLASPVQVAKQLHVTPQCVNAWHRNGQIPARIDEGRIVRFSLNEVSAALSRKIRETRNLQKLFLLVREGDSPKSRNLDNPPDKTAMHRFSWTIKAGANEAGWTVVPVVRLYTIKETAEIIQTTRQTVAMWLRKGIIPARISSENILRFDIEEVLEALRLRAARKRCVNEQDGLALH